MPREHEVRPDDPAFLHTLMANLQENLDRWKRVQGGQDARCRSNMEADHNFYTHVAPKNVLDEMTAYTGESHPPWGTGIVKQAKDGTKEVEWYGMRPRSTFSPERRAGGVIFEPNACDYVAVGLRFSEGHSQWKREAHGPAAKRIRLKDGNVWRPQIIVVIEPLETYHYFKEHCSVDAGNAGKVLQMAEILARAEKKWNACRIVPIRLVLPVVPPKDVPQINVAVTKYRRSTKAKDNSRTATDHDPNINLDDEEAEQMELERVGRKAAQTFLSKGR